jgi:hypothetical protein
MWMWMWIGVRLPDALVAAGCDCGLRPVLSLALSWVSCRWSLVLVAGELEIQSFPTTDIPTWHSP